MRSSPLWILAGLALVARNSVAQTPPADEIVQRASAALYQTAGDFQADVTMTLANARGAKRERRLRMLRINVGEQGDQRYLVVFDSPADVRGLGFLVWKYPRREDDRWLYFPALKVVKRVAADDKRSSFVGSDFTYEDISGRDLQEEAHTFVREDKVEDRKVYVVESKPKQPATYSKRVSWIDSERWLPLKEEYFDARNTLARVFKAEKIESIEDQWTVTVRSMTTVQSKHRTEVIFGNVRYDAGLAEDLFTERSLRNPAALPR
jgi:outer membrane lipoprotein-sorting protein